ncbi:MAG: hypothetical protein Q9217_002595 [Psora testacea]
MGSIDTLPQFLPGQRPIFLFTHPRSASNLFMRLFSNHPQLSPVGYSFFNAFMCGPEKQYRQDHPDLVGPTGVVIDVSKETFQVAYDRLQDSVAKAMKNGKTPLLKEHVFVITQQHRTEEVLGADHNYPALKAPQVVDKTVKPYATASPTNPTLLPDRFLQALRPIILFRHPAKAIPSMFRALTKANTPPDFSGPDFPVSSSLHWEVLLFKWYKEQAAIAAGKIAPAGAEPPHDLGTAATAAAITTDIAEPLVIEADDLTNSDFLVQKLCLKLDVDPAYVQYQWEAVPDAQKALQNASVKAFLSTLHSSTGIVRSEVRDVDLDLDREKEAWIREFGVEDGLAIARFVDANMEDYYFLRAQRL